MALSRIRVLSSTSPTVLAPRPVWGPRCGHLGAQVDATQTRDNSLYPGKSQIERHGWPLPEFGSWGGKENSELGRTI